jgi:hypothetical protein
MFVWHSDRRVSRAGDWEISRMGKSAAKQANDNTVQLYAISGRDGGGARVWSGECLLSSIFQIAGRSNYSAEAGLDTSKQDGVNRAWDKRRSESIARGMEQALRAKQPLEHGAVILVDTKKAVREIDANQHGPVKIAVPQLDMIDRQHSIGALEFGIRDPSNYPNLHKYVSGGHTVTIKIIQCDRAGARKRFKSLNYRPKPLSPVEKMLFLALDALDAEENGDTTLYAQDMADIVGFMAWHDLSRDEKSCWNGKIVVDSAAPQKSVKKNPIPVKHLVDQTSAIYQLVKKNDVEFSSLSIYEKVARIKKVLHHFWQALANNLPESTGEKWYNYLFHKRGARLLVKVHAALLRMYDDRKGDDTREKEPPIKGHSVYEFCEKIIPEWFIGKAMGDTPYKSDDYWNDSGNGIVADKDNEEKSLTYMWKTLNGYGWKKWNKYCDSAGTNPSHNLKRDIGRKEKKLAEAAPSDD